MHTTIRRLAKSGRTRQQRRVRALVTGLPVSFLAIFDRDGTVTDEDARALFAYAAGRGVVGPKVHLLFHPYRVDCWTSFPGAAWQVLRHGFQTDPSARNDGYNKTFRVDRSYHNERATLESAKRWASQQYGVTDWATIPGLDNAWFPKPVADLVKADLRAARN